MCLGPGSCQARPGVAQEGADAHCKQGPVARPSIHIPAATAPPRPRLSRDPRPLCLLQPPGVASPRSLLPAASGPQFPARCPLPRAVAREARAPEERARRTAVPPHHLRDSHQRPPPSSPARRNPPPDSSRLAPVTTAREDAPHRRRRVRELGDPRGSQPPGEPAANSSRSGRRPDRRPSKASQQTTL